MSVSVSSASLRVTFVNDISYVAETLIPELGRFGIEAELVGRHTRIQGEFGLPFPRQSIRSVLEVMRSRPEVLHINYALFGFVSLARPGTPTVLHFHGEDIRGLGEVRDRLAAAVSKASVPFANEVWHSTPDLGPVLADAGIESEYAPNPVASSFFEVPTGSHARPTVLFAMPMSMLKGADLAVEAMRILAEEDPGIRILGFGFGADEKRVALLRSRVPPSVALLPWTRHDMMPNLLAGATVVVGQLRLGILSLLELESLAAARPVVMHLPGSLALAENYYHDDPPVLNEREPSRVVAEIRRLVGDGEACRTLGAAGREWASRYHSAQVVASLYSSRYRALVQKS